MINNEFKYLFSPLPVGSITLKNRFVQTSHAGGLLEGSFPMGDKIGDRYLRYLEKRAKGGVGFIGTQCLLTHFDKSQDMFRSPDFIPGLKKIPEVIHKYDAHTYAQIAVIGPEMDGLPNQVLELPTPWAASPVASCPVWGRVPHQATVNEIKGMVEAFGNAARVSREAGFDAVEIHAHNNSFLWTFMSPFFNRRDDNYGGSVQKRLAIILEVIASVREAVGKDFTVGIRITGDEFIEGGITLEDMNDIIPIITGTGQLDYISVSQGGFRAVSISLSPMYFPLAPFVYIASAVKKLTDIPVVTVGRINDPVLAEKILEDGQADLIGMCRALICDPELPKKARDGRTDDIRKCIACLEGCWGMHTTAPITCVINPSAGREYEPGWGDIEPAPVKKNVMIIGGGPAGLEVARVAAIRGHKVSLYEQGDALGGKTLIAAKAPRREDFGEISRYYTHEMNRLNVNIFLGFRADINTVYEEDPDVVIIATGSLVKQPDIPGADQPNVVEVKDVLAGNAETGRRVLIIDDEHGIQALSAADMLASQGKSVELVCDEFYSGLRIEEIEHTIKWPLYKGLFDKGVVFTPLTKVRKISGSTVITSHVFTEEEKKIDGIDTVVYSCSDVENNKLYYELKGKVKELYAIGDCSGVRKLVHATRDGAVIGRLV